jgi:hypothetical protein
MRVTLRELLQSKAVWGITLLFVILYILIMSILGTTLTSVKQQVTETRIGIVSEDGIDLSALKWLPIGSAIGESQLTLPDQVIWMTQQQEAKERLITNDIVLAIILPKGTIDRLTQPISEKEDPLAITILTLPANGLVPTIISELAKSVVKPINEELIRIQGFINLQVPNSESNWLAQISHLAKKLSSMEPTTSFPIQFSWEPLYHKADVGFQLLVFFHLLFLIIYTMILPLVIHITQRSQQVTGFPPLVVLTRLISFLVPLLVFTLLTLVYFLILGLPIRSNFFITWLALYLGSLVCTVFFMFWFTVLDIPVLLLLIPGLLMMILGSGMLLPAVWLPNSFQFLGQYSPLSILNDGFRMYVFAGENIHPYWLSLTLYGIIVLAATMISSLLWKIYPEQLRKKIQTLQPRI